MPGQMPQPRVPPIRLDDPEASRLRRPLYEDVERLISPGFLSHQVLISGVPVSLRSILPGDLFLLSHRAHARTTEREWREWVISTSIWMVDGQFLLGDTGVVPRIRDTLRYLPRSTLDVLFSVFTGIMNRVSEALARVEAYGYEAFSRSLWRFCEQKSPMRDEFTGVPGTSKLGMNHVQQIWVAHNLIEDERQEWLRYWRLAKFEASAHNPKGIRRIDSKDRVQAKMQEEQRARVIWEVVQRAGGLGGEGTGPVFYRSVTANELADEMQRWVRGDKDWHDQVVEEYKARIRKRFEEEKALKAQQLAEMQAMRDVREDVGVPHPTALVGYTREQLAQIREGQEPIKPGARRIMSDSHIRADLYRRYIKEEAQAGAIRSDGKAVSVQRLEEGGNSSLSDKLEGRQVRWSSDGISKDGGDT